MAKAPRKRLSFHPLTPDRWDDLEQLFGPERGAYSGCWCMFWRVKRKEFDGLGKAGRKKALRKLVKTGGPLGLLAYEQGRPVGWCAIAPRQATPALDRSIVCRPVDERPVWSITCFYVERGARRGGVMAGLIAAAVAYAKRSGAEIVEAYPWDVGADGLEDARAYMGTRPPFAKLGFKDTARRRPKRPLMRIAV
jgi:GNAT superfamily N-acetyltransferase